MVDQLVKVYDDIFKSSRSQDLSILANENGFTYSKRQSFSSQTSAIKGFKVFSKKGAKRFLGIMEEPAAGFDGHTRFYDFLRTRDLETYTTSVIEIHSKELFADHLIIEPKGALEKFKGFFASETRDFPELKEFYSSFQISSLNPDASHILNPAALQLMSQMPKLTCEAEGNYFMFYIRKKEMKIKHILRYIDLAEEFVELLHNNPSQPGEFV